MARLPFFSLLIAILVSVVNASSAPVFCKCTCFKNSTIIPLGPKSQQPDSGSASLRLRSPFLHPFVDSRTPDSHVGSAPEPRSPSTSCSECTKSFCLSQGIDFCKDATEEDVVTLCFQRDSNKDKIIVWGFILGTAGLLGWAAFKRVVEHRERKRAFSQQNINYAPVGNGQQ